MVKSVLNIKNYNNDFLIVKSADRCLLGAVGKSLFEGQYIFVDEVIITELEVCIKLNDHFGETDLQVFDEIDTKNTTVGLSHKLPVCFNDTDDWESVVAHAGLKKSDIINEILETELSVAMFGFLPGFVYLDGLDSRLHIPRKTVPSKYVKANSLAIGGKYMGIYSLNSPGGWHVIGQVPLSILNLESLPPVDFNIGDTIRLVEVDQQAFDRLVADGVSFKSYNAQ